MPYISKEEVKNIRANIKKEFPQFKFSVTGDKGSSVCVAIMSGPLDFNMEYEQINHFYYAENFKDRPAIVAIFAKILELIDTTKNQYIQHTDADYGNIPNYYIHLHVGRWDKPYQLTGKTG